MLSNKMCAIYKEDRNIVPTDTQFPTCPNKVSNIDIKAKNILLIFTGTL